MNNNTALPVQSIEPAVLEEAADWLTLLYSGNATEADRLQLEHWCYQSEMHLAAWQRAESVMNVFHQAPAPLVRSTLSRVASTDRRRMLKAFLLLLMTTPAAWITYQQQPWQKWQADLHTATGEQQSHDLTDGTRLILNTATAVDVAFSDDSRRLILLRGEILISTGKDPAPASRPFLVHTAQGQMRALGTHFTVHQLEDQTRLAVYHGAVEITPHNTSSKVVVTAGEQRLFTATHLHPAEPAADIDTLWQQGMLLARDMLLSELLNELSRYRRGILRCDPAVANLQVSGAFPINNIDASLTLLQQSLPVQVSRISPWWVMVKAR